MSEPRGRVVMVVPTYDEAENIAWIIGRLRTAEPDVDVLVVDDSSPDGTGEIADRIAAEDDQVHVLHRTGKGGLGAAYLAGFAWALERGYDVVGEMDADGSHQPEQLHRLLDALESADLVIGSRWVPGGSVVNWPRRREALSRGGNLYVRLLLGVSVRDATAGYRLFRRQTLEKIDLSAVRSTGYVFQTDLVARTLASGRMPAREIADGALVLLGGALMLSPGFVTDAFGILLILPLTRPFFRRLLTSVVARRLVVVGPGTPGFGASGFRRTSGGPRNDGRPGPEVVRGDVVDEP